MMKGKFKAFTILFALLLLPLSLTGVTASAEESSPVEPIRTINDYDASEWTLPSGAVAEQVQRDGKYQGVEMRGADGFTVRREGLDLMEFMVDFSVFPAEGESPTVTLALEGESGTVASFGVLVGEKNYSAELSVGGKTVKLTRVSYGKGGEGKQIELRLAYDTLLNLETQVKSDGWNFVAGCDRMSNKQCNVFTGNAEEKAAMGEIGSLLSPHLGERVDLSLTLQGTSEPRVFLTQLCDDYYYDYALFPAPTVKSEEDVYYNRIAFSWDLPDVGQYPRSGFKVERLNEGRLEKILSFDTVYASSVSETRLSQGTSYEYRVSAFEEVDTLLNAIACYRVTFKYEPITVGTLEGNVWLLVITILAVVFVLAAIIVGYVYFNDVRRHIRNKRKEKKQIHAV